MPRVLLAVLLFLALPATAAAIPPGLSGDEPISVAGRTIPLTEITHWARIAARSDDRRGARREHFELAAQVLISYRWIEGEAAARGISVKGRTVTRSLRVQTRRSFPSRRHFRRFLRESGQTRADIRYRVRLDLLSSRVRRQVIAGTTDPEERQERLDAFVADFRARWRALTLCTARFKRAVADCANSDIEPGDHQTVPNNSW